MEIGCSSLILGLILAVSVAFFGVTPSTVVEVSDPVVVIAQRYPLVAIVPITGRAGVGALYPALAAGASGLRHPSWALADRVRSVDKRRVQLSRPCPKAL